MNLCWACSTSPLMALEEHHIVPRAFGGTNGPTVILCASCHSLVHKRDQIHSTNPRIRQLAKICVNSEKLVQNDRHRLPSKFQTTFDPGTKQALVQLSASLGISQSATVTYAIKFTLAHLGDSRVARGNKKNEGIRK